MTTLAFVVEGRHVSIEGGSNDAGESKYRVWVDAVRAGEVNRTRHSGVGGIGRPDHVAWVHWCWSAHPDPDAGKVDWYRGRTTWCHPSRIDAIRTLVAHVTRPS
jgi:hypothetical protein